MTVIVEALNGGVLDGAVHAFHLSVRPGMTDFGQAVLDAVLGANPSEDMTTVMDILGMQGELDTIVSEHCVDLVGNGINQVPEKLGSSHFTGLPDQLDKSELAGAVDGDKEIDFSFTCAQLSNVDVKVPNRIAFELALGWLLSLHIRQAGDAMALQAAMQRGSCQMGDGWLKGIKAVIQWQQGVPPKGHDHGLFLEAENA